MTSGLKLILDLWDRRKRDDQIKSPCNRFAFVRQARH